MLAGTDLQVRKAPLHSNFLQITFLDKTNSTKTIFSEQCIQPFANTRLFKSEIAGQIICDEENVKQIIEVKLNTSYEDYLPGDTIGILPRNTEEEVDFIINRLNLAKVANTPILIETVKTNKIVPNFLPKEGSTIKHILTWCLDIRCIPKKIFLRCIMAYTSDERERIALEEVCSDYSKHILANSITFMDILRLYPSCTLPFERLLEHIPRLTPRPYSICSSPLESGIKIVLSVIGYKNNMHGVCSGWLYRQLNDDLESRFVSLSLDDQKNVHFYFRTPTKFHLPEDGGIPVVMISTGTGIAPFLSFLRHRSALLSRDATLKFSEMYLFHGCRYSLRDFIFRDELHSYVTDGLLTDLFVSFSRESNEVKYVQDNMKLNRHLLFDLIYNRGANVYVCGSGKKMATDVRDEILDCLKENLILEIDAKDYFKELSCSSKYLEDVWF